MKKLSSFKLSFKLGFLVSILVVFGFAFMQTACSIDVSLSDLTALSFEKGTIINNAVTSDQKGLTLEDKYQVQSSSGSMTDKVVDVTDKGYTVFVSTQGALFPVTSQ
ncbi:MAG: hypothetical protein ACXVCP_20255 [Bdellovibrio sp.]